jgi:hypothetical protein
MKIHRFFIASAVSLAVFLAITCSKKSTEPEPKKNSIPTIDSLTVDRNVSDLDWGASCIIRCNAKDADNDKLSYKWKVSGGTIIPLSEVQPLGKRSSIMDSTVLDWSDSTRIGWKAPARAGGYTCTVWVTDGKDTTTRNTFLSVFDHPKLDVSKTLVDFGILSESQTSATQTFDITNKGTGILTWTITKGDPAAGWLTNISPATGATATETVNVTLTVNGALLGEGVNTTTITVQSSGGDTTITVKAEKAKPVLDVTKTLVDFGAVSGTQTQTFGIKNKGTGTLSWTATKGDAAAAWLTGVSPALGTATSETDNVTLTVNGALLSPGVNNTTVKVQSNGGDTTVTVTATKSDDVSGGQWISYDDGSFEGSMAVGASGWLWARFTRPTGWTHCKVTKVKVYVKSGSSYSYDIDGFDNYQYSNGYYYPSGTYSSLKTSVSQGTGWSTFDLTTPKTFSSSEFFIALWALSSSGPYYGNDTSNPSAARCGGIISPYNMLIKGAQWGIQVYAENTTTSSPAGSIAGKGTASPEKGVWLKAEVQYRQLEKDGESVGNLKERINK